MHSPTIELSIHDPIEHDALVPQEELVDLTEQVERDMGSYEQTRKSMLSLATSSEFGYDEEEDKTVFEHAPRDGLTEEEVKEKREKFGRNEIEEKIVPLWYIFVSQLWEPMPIMIWIAAAVEAAIQNFPDMGILLAIQFANASISFYEITKAGNAVAALKNSLKPTCSVKRNGKWLDNHDATDLVPGDLVKLFIGGAVPADCYLNEGQLDIDQSAMTGESLPVTMFEGDIAKMGSNVMRGETEATVETTGKNTFFGKTAALLEGPNEISNLQKLLIRIMIVLVIISFLLSGIVLIYLLVKGEDFSSAISFTVVLIVASIPLAIEIVTTTTLALGSREMSQFGAIVSRLGAIEDMAGMNMLCSDKTGTLTKNKMEIQNDTPIYQPDLDQRKILLFAAMAAKWREKPKDALDTLVLGPNGADLELVDSMVEQLDYVPFDPKIKRTESTLRDRQTGEVFKVSKGAPHVICQLDNDLLIRELVENKVAELAIDGIRSLAVAKTDSNGQWHMQGMITFLDPPREDTAETIRRAFHNGVPVKMITGDHLNIAIKTAKDLNLVNPERIEGPAHLPLLDADGKPPVNLVRDYRDVIERASGFAQVFPEHKYLIVECYRQMGYKVGMTGDGVNDAPALKRADIGVAVCGATDAARAAADIILTQEGLSTIVDGIFVSRCIFQRIKNFIVYRIAATLQLLVFFFIAVLAFQPKSYATLYLPQSSDYVHWPAFFHMPVLMLVLITLLNDGTLISIGYDHVTPSPHPEVWNLRALFAISSVLGSVACFSSLILLHCCLDSWNSNGIFARMGIAPLTYGQVTTVVYLKVSVSDFLTLFSARTNDGFFWSSHPAFVLLGAASVALATSTGLACGWPVSTVDGISVQGLVLEEPKLLPLWIWIYCIIWWFIQDAAKVGAYAVLRYYNVFDINGVNAKQLQAKKAAVREKKDEEERLKQKERGTGADAQAVVAAPGTPKSVDGKKKTIGDIKVKKQKSKTPKVGGVVAKSSGANH